MGSQIYTYIKFKPKGFYMGRNVVVTTRDLKSRKEAFQSFVGDPDLEYEVTVSYRNTWAVHHDASEGVYSLLESVDGEQVATVDRDLDQDSYDGLCL